MDIIQQIVVKVVEEIYETIRQNGLNSIDRTIKSLVPVANKMVLDIVTSMVEEMDRTLVESAKAQRRKDKITVKERGVERTIATELGEFHYRRTYFTQPDGSYLYLLDHLIGIEAYERLSKTLVADVLQALTDNSYHHAIEKTTQEISRQTVHNRLLALDDLVMPVERVKETPEILDLFADEDHVHLNPKGNAIVPLVTITEGMDVSNPKRHTTIHPLHMAAYGTSTDAFAENVLSVLTERYDLDKIRQINIHADGGNWIRGLQQIIPHSRLVMDGYHLKKELRAFLRLEGAAGYAKVLCASMRQKDGYKSFEKYCETICRKQSTEDGRKKVHDFMSYCAAHWDSIVVRMSGETCGSCTESLVSHVLSDRLSRDPISWSKEGLNRMTMLIVYSKNGGRITGEDVRIRINKKAKEDFKENGYAIYRNYAVKQADEMLKAKHDWSIFEHDHSEFNKIGGVYLIRKSLGSLQSLGNFIS